MQKTTVVTTAPGLPYLAAKSLLNETEHAQLSFINTLLITEERLARSLNFLQRNQHTEAEIARKRNQLKRHQVYFGKTLMKITAQHPKLAEMRILNSLKETYPVPRKLQAAA